MLQHFGAKDHIEGHVAKRQFLRVSDGQLKFWMLPLRVDYRVPGDVDADYIFDSGLLSNDLGEGGPVAPDVEDFPINL